MNPLKTSLLAMLLPVLGMAGTAAQAQSPAPVAPSTWFTVMGDPYDTTVNTVQVDPVDYDGDSRTMRVRVSRSTLRTSWDGVPYRSYTSNVAFDCDRNKARYLSLSYYAQPGWHGEPDKTVDYTTGPPRMMEFRDVTPNPTQRIIHAACRLVARR
ncbi:MAG: hypothetical protein JWP29_3735 [Rhodoferax sp.]|nr:hypothetical protein [Rhodoferax sp.]